MYAFISSQIIVSPHDAVFLSEWVTVLIEWGPIYITSPVSAYNNALHLVSQIETMCLDNQWASGPTGLRLRLLIVIGVTMSN